jgi:hypothetical protein
MPNSPVELLNNDELDALAELHGDFMEQASSGWNQYDPVPPDGVDPNDPPKTP